MLSLVLLPSCLPSVTPAPSLRVDQTAPVYPMPKEKGCTVEVLNDPPAVPHEVFAHITIRGTEEQLHTMLAKLKEEACTQGADAVIASVDRTQTRLYHETATVGGTPHLLVKDYPLALIGQVVIYTK